MANLRPTLNTILSTLNGQNINTLEAVITCMTPETKLDRIRHAYDMGGTRDKIFDRILSFPAPDNAATYKRLSSVLITSGFEPTHPDDIDGGLYGLCGRAMFNNKNDWVCGLFEHMFHTMVRAQANQTYELKRWIETHAHDDQIMEQASRFGLRLLRYHKLAQSEGQALKMLIFLDDLMMLDAKHLERIEAGDVQRIEKLMQKAQITEPPKIMAFAKRRALEVVAGQRVPKENAPKF